MKLTLTNAALKQDGADLPPDPGADAAKLDAGLEADLMKASSREAAEYLKTLGHEGRLMILCHLAGGEKSVTELETLLDCRQSAVSQQLSRLRMEGLVDWRREGKAIIYTLADPKARVLLATVQSLFCPTPR